MQGSSENAVGWLRGRLGAPGSCLELDWHELRPLLMMPLFGLVLLVAIWAAFFVRQGVQRDMTIEAELRKIDSFAAAFAEYTLRELRDIDRTSWLIKAQFERDGSVNLPYLIRNRLVPANGPIRISVTDRAGAIVASNHGLDRTVNYSDRVFFRHHIASDTGALDISQPFAGAQYGSTAIRMSRRLNLGDRSFGGVVVLSVDPEYFADYYRESQLGPQGLLAMLGTDGVYRMRRTGDRIESAFDGRATALFAAAAASPEGAYVGASSIDHTRRFIAYRKLADYPLIIAVARAEDEVMAPFNHVWTVYLATGLVASLFIFGFFTANTVLAYRARRTGMEVRRQRAFLQALVDNMPLGIVARDVTDPGRDRIIVWNPAAEFIFGVAAEEALGKSVGEVHGAEYARDLAERDRELLASPMAQDFPQILAEVPNRGERTLRIFRTPIFGTDERVEYVLSIVQDITTEESRTDALRLNAKVFETTADAIVISDADDRVIAVNSAFTRLTGFSADEMMGRELVDSPFRPSDPGEFAARQKTLRDEGSVTTEVLRYRKDGSALPCWLTKTCVRDDAGAVVNYLRVFTDISKIKDAQRKLERIAHHDSLTGLLNRRMFHDRLEQALRRAQRAGRKVALLFIDLDRFKRVNDVHGHDAGDALLKEVAFRLQRCVRAADSLCRLGGDEFTIVVEDAALPEDALLVAERIAEALVPPIDIGGRLVECRASIGIALYPDHGPDAEGMYKQADKAMYRAKHSGRQSWVMASCEAKVTLLEKTGT